MSPELLVMLIDAWSVLLLVVVVVLPPSMRSVVLPSCMRRAWLGRDSSSGWS